MTMVEAAAMVAALTCVLLVGFLVPVLIRLRATVAEAGQLLAKLNANLPAVLSEVRALGHHANEITKQVRVGVARVSVLLHAVGAAGSFLQAAHKGVRSLSSTMVHYVTGIAAGGKAVVGVVRGRWRRKGAHPQPVVQVGEGQTSAGAWCNGDEGVRT